MKKLDKIMMSATSKIDEAHDKVTAYLHKILISAGISEEIAKKYFAVYCHGGEWVLGDNNDLSLRDIHIISEKEIIEIVKERENL